MSDSSGDESGGCLMIIFIIVLFTLSNNMYQDINALQVRVAELEQVSK